MSLKEQPQLWLFLWLMNLIVLLEQKLQLLLTETIMKP